MAEREDLERAMKSGRPVRVSRKGLEDGGVEGFVVGCGPKFFVMAVLDRAVRLDGYCALRYTDIGEIEAPAPFADFIEKALRVHGEKPEWPEELKAPELGRILKYAAQRFGLMTIEDEEPDTAFIGKIRFMSNTFLQMVLIGPDAEWESQATEFDFNEIHRVDFGGGYEQTLLRVAQAG